MTDPVNPSGAVWLDTEFTSLSDPRLLSIGLVSGDDRCFYAEVAGVPIGVCSSFVRKVVLPQLGLTEGARMASYSLRTRLREWLAGIGSAVTVYYDDEVDGHLFSEALGIQAEELGLIGVSLCLLDPGVQAAEGFGKVRAEAYRDGRCQHHALHDALALRAAHLAAVADLSKKITNPAVECRVRSSSA